MAGQEETVQLVLRDPDEVRKSRKDESILLFYRSRERRYVCAVVRKTNSEGFLVTAYPTDAIKAGEKIWPRSK